MNEIEVIKISKKDKHTDKARVALRWQHMENKLRICRECGVKKQKYTRRKRMKMTRGYICPLCGKELYIKIEWV